MVIESGTRSPVDPQEGPLRSPASTDYQSKRASAKPLLSNEWETYIHHVGQKFDGGAEEFRLKLCKYALESKYKGQLLCASGKNGNQRFYPIDFGVVDSETEENWTWFLQHLASILATQLRIGYYDSF
ncbi:hypothetical protein L3X38_003777 [Prunus dulcis]|uniref:MULE transposase domain-containing protein n=1 Tax=Prunus dulcis TaxID=3755 RepID=A0AAD4ZMR7_PRUDU|nr:hypothetical protein L3X38_003777 [Prunus dulcis]